MQRQRGRRADLDRAFTLANAQVERGEAPFVILGVADSAGVLRLEACSPPDRPRIGTDAVCLLASITKPIVATTVLQLVEAGRLDLATPLGQWAPDLVNPAWAPITAWHVLTHTSGVHDIDLETMLRHGGDRADLVRHMRKQPQVTAPGAAFQYTTFTYDLLAEVLARVLGRPFEEVIAAQLLEPLGMTSTTFDPRPDPALARRAAPVLVGGWQGRGEADGAAIVGAYSSLHLMGGGLWSTASDLLRFGRAMLRGGELDGVRVLSPAFVDLMTREVTVPRGVTWGGLGSATNPQEASHYAIGWGRPGVHSIGSDRAFGHGGASGTRLWIDPEHDLVYVYLSGSWGLPLAPIDAVEHAIYAAVSA
jgi:CubicO group peptidase (beta-lactamase class C family)